MPDITSEALQAIRRRVKAARLFYSLTMLLVMVGGQDCIEYQFLLTITVSFNLTFQDSINSEMNIKVQRCGVEQLLMTGINKTLDTVLTRLSLSLM